MSMIDFLIPLVIGLAMTFRPRLFFKPSGTEEADAKRVALFRKLGYLLIGVAALYAIISLVGSRVAP